MGGRSGCGIVKKNIWGRAGRHAPLLSPPEPITRLCGATLFTNQAAAIKAVEFMYMSAAQTGKIIHSGYVRSLLSRLSIITQTGARVVKVAQKP